MRKKSMMLIVLIIICVGFLSGCLQKPTYIDTTMMNTNVDIIGKSTRTGFEGFDYVVYVDVTVDNRGEEGKATIWVSLTQGDNQWTENQAIYLNKGETRDLTFTFHEVSFWSLSGLTYRAWIE